MKKKSPEDKIALELKTKILKWLAKPESFYIGESYGCPVIGLKQDRKLGYFDPGDPRIINHYASRLYSNLQKWENIKGKPYITLAQLASRDLFPQIFVSLTVPRLEENRALVQSLTYIHNGVVIASRRHDHYYRLANGELVLWTQTDYQKWRAQKIDLDFFNAILEEL